MSASASLANASFFQRRRALLRAGFALCGAAATGGFIRASAFSASAGVYLVSGVSMACAYNVSFIAPIADTGLRKAVAGAVQDALSSVDAAMSTFKPDSELSRLNRRRSETPLAVSEPTFDVLRTAERVSSASGGAFDITVGPLVNAWGFGPQKLTRIPPARELAQLHERVGYGLLRLDANARTARKLHPDMYVDLSGIAKGYGVDRAARALDALGIANYLVEVGGEVRARGLNADGEPWRVAIEDPREPRRARCVVPLQGLAMATSGDYRIGFDRNGRRYSHEIDPVSASPVEHALTSVTVVAPECAFADACATALMVLGPDRGHALAERLGLAAYFISRAPQGGLEERSTALFTALNPRALGARSMPT